MNNLRFRDLLSIAMPKIILTSSLIPKPGGDIALRSLYTAQETDETRRMSDTNSCTKDAETPTERMLRDMGQGLTSNKISAPKRRIIAMSSVHTAGRDLV